MRNLLFALCTLMTLTAQSALYTELDKKIIYCPEEIVCNESGECEVIGEDKTYFRELSKGIVSPGTYTFSYTYYTEYGCLTGYPSNWPIEQYSFNTCTYKGFWGDKIELVVFNGINLAPLGENWTKWKYEGTCRAKCETNQSKSCPLVKRTGVHFEKMYRNKKGDIYWTDDSKTSPSPMGLIVKMQVKKNPEGKVFHIPHDVLQNNCTNLNRCEVPFEIVLPGDTVYHVGSIYIDVTNDDQIIEITPLSGKTPIKPKLSTVVPNTITFEYDEKLLK